MFEKLKKSHRPYAKKILFELYPDKSLECQDICSKFVKKYHSIVKASIKDLEKCQYINSTLNSDRNSKSYRLSKEGKDLIESLINAQSELIVKDIE